MMIKVCGMREPANIRAVESLGIDMMGFIFYPKSSRYVASRPDYLPASLKKVGVFVNADEEEILSRVGVFGLDFVQLHGSESTELCDSLRAAGVSVIKVFSVASSDDLKLCAAYEGHADLFLFDTRCDQYGGSGASFDWTILDAYNGGTQFLLSGGIGPSSVAGLRSFHHPKCCGVDLNSRFEISPANKDVELLERFIKEYRNEACTASEKEI